MRSSDSTSSVQPRTFDPNPGRCVCITWARAHVADLTEQALTEHHSRCPWNPAVDPQWLIEPTSQEAYEQAVAARARLKMVRDHAKRVAALTKQSTGKTPEEIEQILAMPNPECQCAEPKPRYAHKTWICTKCGGISVPELTPDVIGKLKAAAASTRPRGIDPTVFPKDSTGRHPEVFNGGAPVECTKCREAGNHVYARFAKTENAVWCPRGHTPKPTSMRFTRQLVHRGRGRRAKA